MAAESREIYISEAWEEAVAEIVGEESSQVVLICGPKNSGKSTFSRHLLNSLIPSYGSVGYLEADVGQPEFVPPGCLALNIVSESIPDLAKSALRAPERCYFFGDISSKRDPETYLKCIFNLYQFFVENHRENASLKIPLVINTPGWVKGNGFDILVEILRNICPTVVVQIRISAYHKNLPPGIFWLDGEQASCPRLIEIPTALQDSSNRSILFRKDARELRDGRILRYFSQCCQVDYSTHKRELAYALCSLPPYEVSFSNVRVLHLHCKVPSSEIWHTLNAAIVGLAISSDIKDNIPYCVGLGIVRAIDVAKELLYVLTPVPLQTLQNVDLLLQGFVEIPTSLLQVKGLISPYMASNVFCRMPVEELQED